MEETGSPQSSILLVDDHPANLVALQATLEPLGERLVKAASGEEALRQVLSEDFALILMDVQMPGLDGFETARLIKARERTRHIPVFFITAIHRDETYVLRGYSQGAVDYLVKPFDAELLRAKVKALLELHRHGQQRLHREVERNRLVEGERQRALQQAEAERQRLVERERVMSHQSRLSRAIMDNVTLAVFVLDEQGHVTFMNPAAAEMTGFLLEELQGAPLHETLHAPCAVGSSRELAACVLHQAWRRREPVREQPDVFLRRDGSFVSVRYALSPLARDGQPAGAVLEVRDVTERERTEQAAAFLAEASEVLASSLDEEPLLKRVAKLAVPRLADWCSVETVQEDGAIRRVALEVGDAQKRALAEELDRRFPMHVQDAMGHGHVIRTGEPSWNPEVTETFTAGVAWDAEHLELLRGLGFRAYIVVPLQARGRTLGCLSLAMLESGRRYTAADVPLAVDLARRVALAMDNARLYREAQEAIRMRDEFLSVASHELKTPLTPLALRLQGLLREVEARPGAPLEPRVVASVEAARRQVRRLSDLVNGLLEVSRITSGQLELERERVELSAVARAVAERFQEEARLARCELHVRAARPVEGWWDRKRLEQVVTNLLSNALKYGAGRPVALEVGVEGEQARLVMKDEGIGIAPEHLSRIFERFERAVSDRHYGGLGLGLYICRQIAQALGGKVTVASQPGQGATFTVELPLGGPSACAGAPTQ